MAVLDAGAYEQGKRTPAPLSPWYDRAWIGLALPLATLAIWQGAGAAGALPEYLTPPLVIARTWWQLATSDLWVHVVSSMWRLIAGFAFGAVTGVAVGLAAGVMRPVERFYEPLISLLYPVPKVALLPLIFVWFGLGSLSKIVVIAMSIFFPMYIAAYYGAKGVKKVHVWAALNAGASRLQVFTRVVVPAALPDIFNGLRIGLALAFVLMVTTELVTSTDGLGFLIARAEDNGKYDTMYAAILTIGLLGFGADRVLLFLRRHLLVGETLGKGVSR